MTQSDRLDARYGRTPERRSRRRLLAVAAAVATAVVVTAWVVWVGLFQPTATIESRTLGFDISADDEVVVRFEVSATAGSDVVCALEARNEQQAVVGWKVVELPPSSRFSREFEEQITTSEPAVSGLISRCLLT